MLNGFCFAVLWRVVVVAVPESEPESESNVSSVTDDAYFPGVAHGVSHRHVAQYFPNGCEFFYELLHTCCMFMQTLRYEILLSYL